MLKSLRRIHIGRQKPPKQAKVSSEVIQAAQNLRHSLGQSNTSIEPLLQLSRAIKSSGPELAIPSSTYGLISRSLDKITNYKALIQGHDLQVLFRSLAQENQVEVATKLYMDIYRHSRLSKSEKLKNGLIYFEMLRNSGHCTQADQMVEALFKENSSAITAEKLIEFLVAVKVQPQSVEEDAAAVLNLIVSSQYAFSKGPPTEFLTQGILHLAHLGGNAGSRALNSLVEYIYFVNSHFAIAPQVAVIFLDAFLQLPVLGKLSGGQKVLKLLLGYIREEKAPRDLKSLETCELLLMSCIHFQEPVSSALEAHNMINIVDPQNYSKETWDVLAQFAVYRSEASNGLKSLSKVIDEMPPGTCDTTTFRQVLEAAFMAQYNESQIQKIVELFESELSIIGDASVYEILIRRALSAVEVDKARQIFYDSNTDWNLDNNKYIGVLSELLVALSKTTSISRQQVMECYQRVRLFTAKVNYEAQLALLQMFLHETTDGSLTPAGVFLIEQFGEVPNLPFESHKEIFELFYHRILSATDDDVAWDLFGILNCTITLPYEAYYPLQLKFCSLGRPDASHLMFRQLRNRAKSIGTRPPGEEMYTMLFEEYTKNCYEEGIHELDTYFRMDLNNEMSMKMMNHMLAAYSSLDDGHKVSYLWNEILSLPRGGPFGPNNDTVCIMLQFFSKNVGIDAVDDLWTSLPTNFKLRPSIESLRQYVIANCYHGYYTRALDAVKMAPKHYELEIDGPLLNSLYNWTMLPNRKQEVKEFSKEHYPQIWSQIEASGNLLEIVLPAEDIASSPVDDTARIDAIKQLEEAEQNNTKQLLK